MVRLSNCRRNARCDDIVEGNLRRQFLAALPEHAPSFYFIDIPSSESDRFNAFLAKIEPQANVGRYDDLREDHHAA